MPVITSREFNQRPSQAQKAAMLEPVIITNRGTPAFVLMTYREYEKVQQAKPFVSIADALCPSNPNVADIEFELQPRSRAQRRPVDFTE
ncbi:type II toxin-antitoxin system prevent-host-death family antitoxin [Glaesserella parasuis]|uniref:type II toxin-antitoxin system prevent-host-death family antitoxin n=1 Tax=Glaesserella parasuis TaxID=738 RepID=UPI00094FFF60|nr:type II toxin-antitoxin system prevent-host-death family antitoxin [Glaesserella parasuis]MCT8525355.1 type II toxin-antitoxin system prevent-host-death family antitoxin [Glaesserella parasuis]MCT8527312.1 type II toxin-antitoxin system prevent-host-death family antitoxin [Glaesserella parasuis]MCT8530231.1 type II toxin-antitoxin system prevent-host-death family antitoxin [Glaesserella parasuis]MCT8533058.1 type II toxin-antitoxin system prevent-host-death family antitoxin [Glaesserella par